jgi:hypothetical protein
MTDPKELFSILEGGIIGVYTGLLAGSSLLTSIYIANSRVGMDIIGLGTSIATGLAIAGVLSTYEIKRIHQIHNIKPIEENKLILRLQEIGFERHFIAGVTPIASIGIVTFPFVLQGIFLTTFQATLMALALSLSSLFLFGAWTGASTNRIWYFAGIRASIFGVVTIVLSGLVS